MVNAQEMHCKDTRKKKEYIFSKQVGVAFSHGYYTVALSGGCMLLFTLLFLEYAPSPLLAGWLLTVLLVLLYRLKIINSYHKDKTRLDAGQWAMHFIVGTTLTGLLWGLSFPLFASHIPLMFQAFLVLLLSGVITTAAIFQASIFASYLAFALTLSLPVILYLLQSDLFLAHPTAGVVAFFTALLLNITWRMHITTTNAAALEFHNLALLQNLQKSEERFRTLTENAASAYFIIQDGHFTYINPMGQNMTGYTLKELQKHTFLDLVHPEYREMAPTHGGAQRSEFKITHKKGHSIWIDYTASPIEFNGKQAILGTAFDISDKKKAEERIALNEKWFRMLFNMANDPMFLITMGDEFKMGAFKDVNEAACEILGYTHEELLDMDPAMLNAEENPNLLRAVLAKLSVDGKILYETELRTKDGHLVPVEISSHMTQFEGKTIIHSTMRDISRRKQLMERLTELANTDPLTGCLNRRSFWNRGGGEIARASRYARPLVLLMIDIDRFKEINDTHGHSMGDVVLRSLVAKCQSELRSTDIFGRIGGEEFAALLVETEKTEGLAVAERIRLTVQQMTASYGPKNITCTVSVGMALARDDEKDLDDLMHRADQALYHAKATGRNRVVSYADISE